jgi:hypothetical protein
MEHIEGKKENRGERIQHIVGICGESKFLEYGFHATGDSDTA